MISFKAKPNTHLVNIFEATSPRSLTDIEVQNFFLSERNKLRIPPKSIDLDKNIFNNLKLSTVKYFFRQLTTRFNKAGEPFLTNSQLDQFIDRAFCGNYEIPKIVLNARKGEYNQIVYLFYIFYTISVQCETQQSRKNLKLKYQKLLLDNFSNYGSEDYVMENFHKKPISSKISQWMIAAHTNLNLIESKL